MRRRDFLVLAGAAALGLPRVAFAQSQAVINVGFSYSSPSWSWYDVVSGINNGLMLDLMTAVGADAGFQVQFHGAVLNDLITLLVNKNIDVISTVYTPQRDPQGLTEFSMPIWNYGEALLVKKTDKTDYRSIADLKGKIVEPGNYEAQLRASGVPMNIVPVGTGTVVDEMDRVRSGKSDVIMFSEPTVAYFANSGDYPDFVMAPNYRGSFQQPISVAVRKGDQQLLDKLNTSLKKLMANGTIKTIWTKYHLNWTAPA